MNSRNKSSDEKIAASKKFTDGYSLIESTYSKFEEDEQLTDAYKELANDPEYIEYEQINKARRFFRESNR